MLFRQYLHTSPVAASYFFGCGSLSNGLVVDPMLDQVDFYIQESERLNMKINYVFDTHLHADHVSGARELIKKTGAQYILHRSADVAFDFLQVEDGDEIVAGNTIIKVLYTPGHTPEHISLVVTDLKRGNEPWFVVTGHTLMIGDVGRTELASELDKGAAQLYQSLYQKLLTLPNHLEVYPGAYSGSVCGRTLSGKPSSTIGFERKFNHALQAKDEKQFITLMTKDVPKRPLGFSEIRAYNMGHSDRIPVFIDVRETDEFEQEHISGTINIPLHNLEEVAHSFLHADVTVICKYGKHRSEQAKTILEQQGHNGVNILQGGCQGWFEAQS